MRRLPISSSGLLSAFVLFCAPPSLAQEPAAPDSAATKSPTPAASQDAEPAPEKTEAGTPTEAQPEEPKVDPYAEAKERVGRAEILFKDGNYDAALTEFERAYETMLGHPARPYVLFNIGRCQEKLYRYDDAIASYNRYLELAGDSASDRGTVEAKIDLLEGLLGTLVLRVHGAKGSSVESYEVWVDGRLIGEDAQKFLIPGGNHQVEIRAEGFEVASQEIQIPARSEKTLSFELSPLAQEYKGLSQAYFWTAASLAVGTAAAGGAFGISAVSKRSKLDSMPPAGVTQEDVNSLKSLALTADIFFISAGVFATSATIIAFMTDWSEPVAEDEESPVRVKEVGIIPIQGGGYMSIGGSF